MLGDTAEDCEAELELVDVSIPRVFERVLDPVAAPPESVPEVAAVKAEFVAVEGDIVDEKLSDDTEDAVVRPRVRLLPVSTGDELEAVVVVVDT